MNSVASLEAGWGSRSLVLTIGALLAIHSSELGNVKAMAAKFDPRPIGTMIGTPISCELSPFFMSSKLQCDKGMTAGAYRAYEGQRATLAGLLADRSRERRERGVVNADLSIASFGRERFREVYRGQSGRLPPQSILRTGDGLYVNGNGKVTHAPPMELILAESLHLRRLVQSDVSHSQKQRSGRPGRGHSRALERYCR